MAETSGPSRRGVLLAAAGGVAGVAAVALGTSYAGRGADAVGRPAGPGPSAAGHQSPVPPLPPLQTDEGNRAAAAAVAAQTLATIGTFPGAASSGPIHALADATLSTVTPAGHTERRSAYWTVTGAAPKAVAEWYAAHPPAGFGSGGSGAVGGEGDGRRWIHEVYDEQPGTGLGSPGTSIEVETTSLPDVVGVRVTVSSVWAPARPVTSYVQDVRSIDVRSVRRRLGRDTVERSVRSFTLTDPAQVLHAAVVFNALAGTTALTLPCPLPLDSWTDRIVFHTATGDVSAERDTQLCGFGMDVRRDGKRVGPQLHPTDTFSATLGLRH